MRQVAIHVHMKWRKTYRERQTCSLSYFRKARYR